MRQKTPALTAVAVATIVATMVPARAADPAATEGYVRGRVLVRFAPTSAERDRSLAVRSIRGRVARRVPGTDFVLVRTPVAVPSALARLRMHQAVSYAEPDVTGRVALVPQDTCVEGCGGVRQWNLDAVNAKAGWDRFPGTFYTQATKKSLPATTAIKVAVLDTKIDVRNPDWVNAQPGPITDAYDARNGGQIAVADGLDVIPDAKFQGSADYHGTFVAGIIAGAANNATAIAGLGYHAQIVPISVVAGDGQAAASDVATGLARAVSVGAKVINLSLVLDGYSFAVQQGINRATAAGALVVAAAGNDGTDTERYPAHMSNVMAVAGSDEADRIASCSNFGWAVSVAAPAVDVPSLDTRAPGGVSVQGCGTSTAAPHVSALAALLFAQDPTRSPRDVRAIIERTADDDPFAAGHDVHFGHGRINVEKALSYALGGPTVVRAHASIPPALGGVSSITAVARPASPDGFVEAAEVFIGAPGAAGSGVPLAVVKRRDGGETAFAGEVSISTAVPTGVHRIYVRAFDGRQWSAASSAVLVVDRTSPTVTELQAETAVPALNIPAAITFRVRDDYSRSGTYSYTVHRRYVATTDAIYESPRRSIESLPSQVRTTWMPALIEAGYYTITLTVVDEGGNPIRRQTTVLVL